MGIFETNLQKFSLESYRCHSSQIHQIDVKSKKIKFLKYSLFDSLIEIRKFQKIQLHNPGCSDFMAILRISLAEFEDKMWFVACSVYIPSKVWKLK